MSYQEISEIINKPTKSIDNALQRIKKSWMKSKKIVEQNICSNFQKFIYKL